MLCQDLKQISQLPYTAQVGEISPDQGTVFPDLRSPLYIYDVQAPLANQCAVYARGAIGIDIVLLV